MISELTKYRINFLSGAPFTVAVIQVRQRFQTVSGSSALIARTRLLPFTLSISVDSALVSVLGCKLRIPPISVILFGSILQTVGAALMSTLLAEVNGKNYDYEALLGIGIGLNIGMIIVLTPQVIRGKDQC